jgi:hypothetical protein
LVDLQHSFIIIYKIYISFFKNNISYIVKDYAKSR